MRLPFVEAYRLIGTDQFRSHGYRQSVSQSDNEIASARNWLMARSADDWARAARPRSKLNGTEHQKLWRIINGLET